MNDSWILTSKKVCLDGVLKPAWILIEGEKISDVFENEPDDLDAEVIDVGDLVVLPGMVDTHVHINEPGRTEWEGFETATHAAAAGGITSLVDMPLNCIPVTTSAEALKTKLESVREKLWVDVGFWGGVVPENLDKLPKLLESGVLGVKTFMIDSGIVEFKPLTTEQIGKAMPFLKKHNMPYLFHAEMDRGEAKGQAQGPSYEQFLKSRPKTWENGAIDALISLTEKHRTKTHIVHLSSAQALPAIQYAKTGGLHLTVETCPHYLLLSQEQVKDFKPAAEQTLFKCCPPIREEANRQALWKGIKDGIIDMVVSDHSPCSPDLKHFESTDFGKAWGGISSLQYTLSLIFTEGKKFAVSLPEVSRLLSEKPAKFAGLGKLKGQIAPDFDADLIVFDENEKWKITADNTEHKHKGSPYLGREVFGKVKKTFLRGKLIFDEGTFSEKPNGHFLLKGKL